MILYSVARKTRKKKELACIQSLKSEPINAVDFYF